MKLELPDNNASVLFHMGNALQSIARDIDTSLPVNGHKITHTEAVGDVSHSVTVEPLMVMATGDKNPINIDASERRYLDESELSDAVDNMIDAIAAEHEIPVNRLLGESDTIDADGLPWDQRINSKGRTRIKGDVWRARQKPNDKTDEEWAEYVEGVKTELRALMAIPIATGAELDVLANTPVVTPPVADVARIAVNGVVLQPVNEMPLADVDPFEADPFAVDDGISIEDITQAEVNAGNLPPVVIEATEVVTPPVVDAVIAPPVVDAEVVTPPVDAAVIAPPVEAAVVTPPVDAAVIAPPVDAAVIAPPVDAAVIAPPPTDFGGLMRFITANKSKLTNPVVEKAIADQGLASIALLAARTDLIPQIHAALVKLL